MDCGALKPGYLQGKVLFAGIQWETFLFLLSMPHSVSVAVGAVAGWKKGRDFKGDGILFPKAKAAGRREGGFVRIEHKTMLKAGAT